MKIGRNDPCPCGSGAKYKNCCQPRGYILDTPAPRPAVAPPPALAAAPAAGPALPDPAAARLSNQGNALLAAGQLDEAIACYREALSLDAHLPEVLSNLGNALKARGELKEAINCFIKAIDQRPQMAELHSNLGIVQLADRQIDAAIASHTRALELKPGYAAACFNLGQALHAKGDHAAAVAQFREAAARLPAQAEVHANLAASLQALGRAEEALASYRRAVELNPNLIAAQNGLSTLLSGMVPLWHVPMMNDAPRNEAYHAALRAAITPESTVFEIGTGSGLLSMMAARLGAKAVITCEAEPVVAATARDIVADNGLANKVRVLSKLSYDVHPGEELPGLADIVVSEVLSSELLAESVLPSIEDARRRLLKPGGRMIPAAGSIMVALAGGEGLGANVHVGTVHGFDLSRFNRIIQRKQAVTRNDLDIAFFSGGVEAFYFDFAASSFTPGETRQLRVPVTRAGRCHGLIQWIRLQMDANTVFENHPSVKNPASGWQHLFYAFDTPIDIKPGQRVIVSATHNRNFPWFTLAGIE